MRIAIFGANGPTGRLLTEQAIARGHAVTAFTRHPDGFPLRHDRLRVLRGDVFDPGAVDVGVAGQDAVLSALGVPFTRKPIAVYSQGVGNIAEAMRRHGVRRLVCVSSSATEPHDDPGGGVMFQKVLQPFVVRVLGRTLYEDMKRMERLVMASDLDWTIVRPSGLFASPAVSDYAVAEGHLPGRFTSRTDLADFMLGQLGSDQYVRRVAAVITRTDQPNFLELLWREGIAKKKAAA